MESDVKCPYCKSNLKVTWDLENIETLHKYKCSKCKKSFNYKPTFKELFVYFFGFIIGIAILFGIGYFLFWCFSAGYNNLSDTPSNNSNTTINQSTPNNTNQELLNQYNNYKKQIDAQQKELNDKLAQLKSEQDRIKQYTSKVLFDDDQFRTIAKQIASGCNGEQECQLYKIYRFLVTNFEYYSDPRNNEYVQSPSETWNSKGGDCEDLGILLQTLLESIGIKTFSVFTTGHYYVLGCVPNSAQVLKYSNNELKSYGKYYDKIHYYNLGSECIPLEPTAGEYGFPGHFTTFYSEAYDPLTLEKYTLT
jgi:hypothetical protein